MRRTTLRFAREALAGFALAVASGCLDPIGEEALDLFLEETTVSLGGHPSYCAFAPDGSTFAVSIEVDRSNAAYSPCWAIVHYLVGRVSSEQMDEYVTAVQGGKDPADALSNLLRLPLRTIEAEVRKHVSELQ